jgi:FkbM family methyltransferase
MGETSRRNARDDRHLRAITAAVVGSGDRCVDVGANVGAFLADLVRIAPTARHVAIEPLPHLARDLRRRFPTVDVHAVAASDHEGKGILRHAIDAPALSGLGEGKTAGYRVEEIVVPLRRLDDVVDFAPRLIKIDVEGAELQVLRGATRLLAEGPVVAFEHSNRLAPGLGTRPEQLHRLLADAEMRIFDLDGNGPLGEEEFVAVFERHSHFNFLARS